MINKYEKKIIIIIKNNLLIWDFALSKKNFSK